MRYGNLTLAAFAVLLIPLAACRSGQTETGPVDGAVWVNVQVDTDKGSCVPPMPQMCEPAPDPCEKPISAMGPDPYAVEAAAYFPTALPAGPSLLGDPLYPVEVACVDADPEAESPRETAQLGFGEWAVVGGFLFILALILFVPYRRRRSYRLLPLLLLAPFLVGCAQNLTPAVMSDIARLESKVDAIPESQQDAYIASKAAGDPLEVRMEKSLGAGAATAQATDVSSESGFADWIYFVITGAAATGATVAGSRKRRNLSMLTGKPIVNGAATTAKKPK